MTKSDLIKAMEKYRDKRAFTRVRVNEAGRKAFSDTRGEFYITGIITKYYIDNHGRIKQANIANIARTPSGYSRDINAGYLEEVN